MSNTLLRDGIKWRPIDSTIASTCIQKIQELINSGELKANDIIVTARSEKAAKILFNGWRVFFLDRMAAEYDKQGWKNIEGMFGERDADDLNHDVAYYNKLVEKEQQGLPYQTSDIVKEEEEEFERI
jgi:hypothetical protein